MQVFRAVKNGMGDMDRFQHFSIEQTPETEQELIERNAYLLEFVITAIWFEKGAYDLVEGILRHLRNEVRYRRGGNDNFKSAPAIVNQNEINKSGLSISSWAKFKLSFFKSLSWFTN